MKSIQALGLTTAYEQIGTGPVLVLLHGWANTWEAWLPVIPYLSDHFTLIMPDLPGCGKTQTPEKGWSTEFHAQWLEDFLLHLSPTPSTLTPLFLCGHSYGGKIIIQHQTSSTQHQAKKIVLMDASGIPARLTSSQKKLQFLAKIVPDAMKWHLPKTIRKQMYHHFGADSDYLTDIDFYKKTLRLILREDLTEKLSHIRAQTLLLWGSKDAATPLWQAEIMNSLIRNNKLIMLDAGHFPHHEYPQRVADEIIHFLRT